MNEKQSNKEEQKVPEFKVTPYIGFFDVYFRRYNRIYYELEQLPSYIDMLPTNRTDEYDCRLYTTLKFTGIDSVEDYLSRSQQEDGYNTFVRFKRTNFKFINGFLCDRFFDDEFFIKRIQYVFDFESKKPVDLLELITESIEIDFDSTVYENIQGYVEICENDDSKEPIIRLNIVLNYPNESGMGVFGYNEEETDRILDHVKFFILNQDVFLSTLTNQCMHITDSQMESLKKQLQDTTNMKDLREIISRYVDDYSQCFKDHQLQSLFETGITETDLGDNPPSYDTKMMVLNTKPNIIPELEYYLPDIKSIQNKFSLQRR